MTPRSTALRFLLLVLVAGLCGACSYVRFYRDFDTDAEFARYRTFTIVELPPTGGDDPRGLSTLDAGRVREGLERALFDIGLEPAGPLAADLRVDFRFTTEELLDIDTWGPVFTGGFGYFNPGVGFYGAGANQVTVEQRTQGTLVVDLIDRRSGQLVWRGWAVRDVENFDELEPDERREALVELVDGILAAYPPPRSDT